jgi:hypothetical protein
MPDTSALAGAVVNFVERRLHDVIPQLQKSFPGVFRNVPHSWMSFVKCNGEERADSSKIGHSCLVSRLSMPSNLGSDGEHLRSVSIFLTASYGTVFVPIYRAAWRNFSLMGKNLVELQAYGVVCFSVMR